MILVDTSVWIDHLRFKEPLLTMLLERGAILAHPWVTGELALGNMRNRAEVLHLLGSMPQIPVIDHGEVLAFIASERLHGRGIGLVDVHLLASVRITPGTLLWTRDNRLSDVAEKLALRFEEAVDTREQEM